MDITILALVLTLLVCCAIGAAVYRKRTEHRRRERIVRQILADVSKRFDYGRLRLELDRNQGLIAYHSDGNGNERPYMVEDYTLPLSGVAIQKQIKNLGFVSKFMVSNLEQDVRWLAVRLYIEQGLIPAIRRTDSYV